MLSYHACYKSWTICPMSLGPGQSCYPPTPPGSLPGFDDHHHHLDNDMLFSTTAGRFRNRSQHTRQQQKKSTCRVLTVPCESITIRDLLLKTLTGHLINFATALAQKAICCKDMHLETHCIKLEWLVPQQTRQLAWPV